ncbi:hypothetical protein LXL04_024018 [Taraxacum kok-saghyz]
MMWKDSKEQRIFMSTVSMAMPYAMEEQMQLFCPHHKTVLASYMYLMSVDIFLLWLKTRLLKSCLEISKQRVLTPPTKVKHVVKGKISQRKTNAAKCPIQPGITECGYYVLKFMKAIVDEGLEVLTNNFWEKVIYTDAELDMVRKE